MMTNVCCVCCCCFFLSFLFIRSRCRVLIILGHLVRVVCYCCEYAICMRFHTYVFGSLCWKWTVEIHRKIVSSLQYQMLSTQIIHKFFDWFDTRIVCCFSRIASHRQRVKKWGWEKKTSHLQCEYFSFEALTKSAQFSNYHQT